MIVSNLTDQRVIDSLANGQLVVAKTDTIYGILASANNPEAVARLYQAKKRRPPQPSIILLADYSSIPGLSKQQLDEYRQMNLLRPTTIVTSAAKLYEHLPHHDDTLAFRVIEQPELKALISAAGPLLAPSANPEGLPPAENVQQAIDYFGEQVAVFVDSGATDQLAAASQIVKFTPKGLEIIRR